jgi:hypothetical protein
MHKKITAGTRHELVNALRGRYQVATRAEKARILSEFVAVSGYHRKQRGRPARFIGLEASFGARARSGRGG